MKKFFLFCAAMVAAFNANAAITEMTCAQAKQYTLDNLQSGETGTDSVAVTGFVTYTNGTLSRGQQTFWLDDEKGTTQTFQAYWCNIPGGEDALNVGDKVTIKGFLLNYNGTTAEMKNGDTEILERVVIKRDTIDATVCEVIEEGEALNNLEITNDFFIVEGVVASVSSPLNQYKQETFSFTCEDNNKELKVYNILMDDSIAAAVGDKVEVLGKIQNYNGTIELISGNAKVTEKGQVTIDTIEVTVAQAVEAAMALPNGGVSKDIYVINGYVDSIAIAYDAAYGNISFFMTDDMANPTYDFEAYRVKVDSSDVAKVVVGAKVTVTAALQHYYKAEDPAKELPEINLAETVAGGTMVFAEEQAIENVAGDNKAVKTIKNGQVVIIRNGVRYNALGAEVK